MITTAGASEPPTGNDPIARGAVILRLMTAYTAMLATGRSATSVLIDLRRQGHPLAAIEALSALDAEPVGRHLATVLVRDLRPGMTLDEDVQAKNGVLLVARGQELTHALLERIANFHRLVGLTEPIRVHTI
jgi:type VI protein secretion system component VasA